MSDGLLPVAGALLSLLGALFFLVAAVGLLRLPDLYSRAHSLTKAATLGMILAVAGSVLRLGPGELAYWLEEMLLILFVLVTVPIGTQMLVRGAVARGVPQVEGTRGVPTAPPIERLDEPDPES